MSTRRPQLAKLTRPRLHSAITRERLFRTIDAARQHPVTWIVGPPGAGKTTLVSTYLDAAGAPTLWYQVDSGDDDPAAFFYYLREAAIPYRGRRKPLPLLTPEYLGDIAGFARRFFREFFLGLPAGTVIALDNYQDAADAGQLHALLAVAIEEIPPQTTFIVMSRSGPPAALARARVGERIAEIGASDLQLDFDETRAIAGRRAVVDEPTMRLIFEQSNGWTAGVMLLLERVRRDGVLYRDSRGTTSEATFDYFASQIFDGSPPETRRLLMAVSWLPQVTVEAAVRVSGNANAVRVLEFLYRHHLFVDRRPGDVPAYQFHALFRAFLRHRAEAELDEAALENFLGLAADVLAESGAVTEALPLLIRSGRWASAVSLLVRVAPILIGQGRWRTFEDLVAQIPEPVSSADAWLQHWLGQSQMASSPALAQQTFARAYELFIDTGGITGAALCAAGMIESVFHTFIDFAQMDVWIDRLDRLLAQGEIFDDPVSETRVRSALVMIGAYRVRRGERATVSVQRLLLLLDAALEADLMIVAATALLNYAIMTGDTVLGERVSPRVEALLASPHITPHRAVRCQGSVSYWAYVAGRYEQAFDHAARAIALARDHGLPTMEFHVMACIGYCYGRAGMTVQARHMLEGADAIAPARFKSPLAFIKGLAGLVALLEGDPQRAVRLGLECVAGAEASGALCHFVVFRVLLSDWAIAAGDIELADRIVRELRHWILHTGLHRYEPSLLMAEAHLAWERGDRAEALRRVRESLQLARERGGLLFLRWRDTAMPKLLPLAIEHGIEPAVVQRLIRDYKVASPAEPVEHWPWPVAVTTLGRFEIRVDGEPLRYGTKAPKRTLALLKAIIAFGGIGVPEARLTEALWPDLDGDDAHRAFEAALHRLRRLIGDADAIRQQAGALSLDPARCWVDMTAFEFWVSKAADDVDADRHALSLYRGALLSDEPGEWMLPARERVRDKFIRVAARAAARHEAAGDLDAAIALYLRGLDADPLVESFYQGLMRCYGSQSRSAEAASVYRRMRQTLSVVLGVAPSPASDRIFRETVYQHGTA